MQVGREVYRGIEYALVILPFALTIELLPPLTDIVKAGMEVAEDLDLLACLIEAVASCSVECGGVLCEGDGLIDKCLHFASTTNELTDIEASYGDGEQTDGGQYREASTDVVGDDEGLIALLVCESAQGATRLVGDGDDALASFFASYLLFEECLEDAEGDSGLSRRTALGDIDQTEALVTEECYELTEVVLTDVVPSEDHLRSGALRLIGFEGWGECFDDSACTEVASTDADTHDIVAALLQSTGSLFDG